MDNKDNMKYPIKYAIMPIIAPVGWYPGIYDMERAYDKVANIVSKCYVISEKKQYLRDGTYEFLYEIVFPFRMEDIAVEIEPRRTTPHLNLDGQCTNSVYTKQLFNNFEDAKIVANKLNEKILNYKKNHQETLDRYKKYEKYINNETSNMRVTFSSTLNEIIEKIVENSCDFYIKLANTLSSEEKEYLRKVIENKNCNNCTNESCNVLQCEKVGLDENGMPRGSDCLGWNNSELIGRQRVLINHPIN